MRPQVYHSPQVCPCYTELFPMLSALHVLLLWNAVKALLLASLSLFLYSWERGEKRAGIFCNCLSLVTAQGSRAESPYSAGAEKIQFQALHCVTCDPPLSSLEWPSPWNDQADCLASSSGLIRVEDRMLLLRWLWQCPEGNTEEKI